MSTRVIVLTRLWAAVVGRNAAVVSRPRYYIMQCFTCYTYINLFHLTLLTLPYNVGNQVSESVLRSKIISLEDKIQSQELLIKKLQNQLRSTNANKSLTISQGEVHDEEAVLLTCGKIKELLVAQHNARCCNFCGQQSESVVIEKRTGRFVANFIF